MSRKALMWTMSLLVIASMLLAGCQQAAAPTAAPAEPTAAAPAAAATATTAPAAPTAAPAEPTATTAAAVPTATTAPAASGPQTLRINMGTYPDNIDPQKASFVNEIATLKMVYEGLTRLNDKLETVPGAAESWKYNSDATQLTFTLRQGLKYSDGSLLNAKRFEYSILRNINPATAGEYASITDDIKGAPEWRSADIAKTSEADMAKLKAAVGVHAQDASGKECTGYDQTDCLTLVIDLGKPAPYFHTVMSLWVTYPAKEELITAGGDTWQNDAKNQLGNGPMILDTLEQNTRMLFTPNTNYWRGTAKVDIEYRYITDSAVSFEAYKNNEFDVIAIAAEDLATIQADPQLNSEALLYPGSCTFDLNFHEAKEPFNDKAVREAFSYAFDRAGWVTDVLQGLGSPTQTWIPKGFPGYDASEDRFSYDPAKAQQTLKDAGYTVDNGVLTKGGKTFPITLTFSDTPRNRTRNEWIAGKWKQDLGLSVTLNPVESTTYTALTKDVKTAPQVFILGWCADYPDPQNWLSVYWKSDTTFASRIAYNDPAFDKLVNQADIELDPAKRMDLYMQAQKELIGSAPGPMVWNNVNAYLVKPNIKGLVQTPQDADFPGSTDPLTITIEPAQ